MTSRLNWKALAFSTGLGALAAAGCIAPPPTAPGAAPGSPASIGGGAAAFKDCGPEGLIDDGEDGNNQNLPVGNRGGYWYTFMDPTGSTNITPMAGAQGGTFAMTEGGANGTKFAANFKGKVGTGGSVVYGGMGVNFVDPKDKYDASKYVGIAFFAKRGDDSVGKVRLKVPDMNTDPDGAVCTECFNDFGADLSLTPEWKKYIFPFKKMTQEVGWGAPRKPHVVPSTIYGIQWQVKVPGANYDISIDDLQFVCQ